MHDIYDNDEPNCVEETEEFLYPEYDGKEPVECRTILQSQVNLLDFIVGRIASKLKRSGIWDETLFVFSSDNV